MLWYWQVENEASRRLIFISHAIDLHVSSVSGFALGFSRLFAGGGDFRLVSFRPEVGGDSRLGDGAYDGRLGGGGDWPLRTFARAVSLGLFFVGAVDSLFDARIRRRGVGDKRCLFRIDFFCLYDAPRLGREYGGYNHFFHRASIDGDIRRGLPVFSDEPDVELQDLRKG